VDHGEPREVVFVWIENVTVALFSIEYLVRLCTAWAVPAIYFVPSEHLRMWQRSMVNADAPTLEREGASAVPKEAGVDDGTAADSVAVEVAIGLDESVPTASLDEYPISLEKQTTNTQKTLLFVKSPANVLDLIAIAPFYLEVCRSDQLGAWLKWG